jgi:hypothetical protein
VRKMGIKRNATTYRTKRWIVMELYERYNVRQPLATRWKPREACNIERKFIRKERSPFRMHKSTIKQQGTMLMQTIERYLRYCKGQNRRKDTTRRSSKKGYNAEKK